MTLSAMKSNQWWHSITPHSAVATSARLRARVVQSCHQDIRTRRSLITSLYYTLLAFTFLLLISSMPPEFYRKPISAPSGHLDRVSLPRPQPLKVEHSGIITFIASCHARCSAHKRLCRHNKLPEMLPPVKEWWPQGGPQIRCEKANFCPKLRKKYIPIKGIIGRPRVQFPKVIVGDNGRRGRVASVCAPVSGARPTLHFSHFTFCHICSGLRVPD